MEKPSTKIRIVQAVYENKLLAFTLLLFFVCFQIGFSQESKRPILVDGINEPVCGEQLKARLDSVASQVKQQPQSNLYIIFYGEMREVQNRQYLGFFKQYLSRSYYPNSINKDNLFIIRGANQEKMKVQMWLVPNGATPVEPESKFNEEGLYIFKPVLKDATLFYKIWVDVDHGEYGGGGLMDDSCPHASPTDFAKALLKSAYLTGYLVVSEGENKNWAKKASKQILKDIIQLKVPRKQLVTVFVKSKSDLVELWLIPKDSPLPESITQKVKTERF